MVAAAVVVVVVATVVAMVVGATVGMMGTVVASVAAAAVAVASVLLTAPVAPTVVGGNVGGAEENVKQPSLVGLAVAAWTHGPRVQGRQPRDGMERGGQRPPHACGRTGSRGSPGEDTAM